MVIIKTQEQIAHIREAGRRLAQVLEKTKLIAKIGVNLNDLDAYAEKLILEMGDRPAFKGYKPYGVSVAFPGTLCLSVNEEVVHGMPRDYILKDGDILSIDCGINHKGFFADHAVTIGVGGLTLHEQALINDTQACMYAGINVVKAGCRTGDIGYAVEKFVARKYGIVRDLAGHGVGVAIHEDPFIPNFGKAGTGEVLKVGAVIAIEPMLIIGGDGSVKFHNDGYTVSSKNKGKAAHFEHTVLVTETGYEILTQI